MRRKAILVTGVIAVCALSAVATAFAASGSSSHASAARHKASTRRFGARAGEGGGPPAAHMGPGGPGAVHAESVVLNKAGTEFITETTDNGTIKTVEASAGKLTIVEGVKSVTYKTVTLTIPSGATVTLDGKSSSLSALAEGDHVMVASSSEGTMVWAADASFHPEGPPHPGPGQGAPPASG